MPCGKEGADMTSTDSIAAISRRELKHTPAVAPVGTPGAYEKKGGLAYGLLYLAAVFGFSVWMTKGKKGGGR